MTRMRKAMHKQAEWKYMTVSIRTGNMVKENRDKATRFLCARRKYLGKQRQASRYPSIQI